MKKIDLMLKLLFLVAFANVSHAQVLGGANCETAVPLVPGTYLDATAGCVTEWYSFTAGCGGELRITDAVRSNGKRLYSGECGSLTLEAGVSFSGTVSTVLEEGETVYFESLNDNWCNGYQWNILFENDECPQPGGLTGFATEYDEAIVGWFGGGGDDETFALIYGPTGFDPAVDGTTILVDGTFETITGLEELTCYDVYLRSLCADGEVSCELVGPITFCTPAICPAPLAPNETAITNMETTLNWSAGDSEDDWDIQWGPEGFELGDGDAVEVGVADDEFLDLIDLDPATCYDWYVRAECEVLIDGVPEIVYSLWVGPNEWCTNANCLDPSDGTMVSSGGLNAVLSWTENNAPDPADEWNIQYGEPGFTIGEGVTITNIPTNPYNLTGLEPGTEYCYYVQAVCGEGEDSLSGWAGPYCFTTDIFCPEPSLLFAEGTSGTEADLSWSAGGAETAWDISWGTDPLDDPEMGTMEDAAAFPSLGLTGLTAGESYCFYVRANCGGEDADSSSVWVGPYCWTQPALCATPFALDIINITNTAAHFDWSSPGAESWDVEWGEPCFEVEAGEEIGSVDATLDDPYYMTGLDANTPYWAYVRATCGVDSVSAWAGPILFGTDLTNDDPCDAETLVLDGPMVVRHNFGATTLPGETGLLPDPAGCTESTGWCAGDGVDRTVWFQFVAPEGGQAVVNTFNESECVTNGYTEIAIYTTGSCSVMENFELVAANSLNPGAEGAPYGSTVTACGLEEGATYYVMVNPISYIQPDVHFGITLSSVEEVSAGLGLSPTVCQGSTVDLFTTIAGHSSEDGTWYNPTVAPGNEFGNLVVFPDVEGAFTFFYVVENGCTADTVETTITTDGGLSAGLDGFVTTCNDYDIILSDHLGGVFAGAGEWRYDGVNPDVALSEGLFIPLGMDAGVYKFEYTIENDYCEDDTAVVTVVLIDCSDLDEETENALAVYPNPVVDVLTVSNISIEGNATIEVLDIEGRVIISNQVSNVFENYTIDMSNIESGVYFVKVTADDTVRKVRVVKK